MEQISFFKISEDKESVNITIEDDLVVISFINVPQKLTKLELLLKLGFESENDKSIVRFYKKSLFWNLAILKDKLEFCEKNFKQINFGDGNLKYDVMNKSQMIKNINKQIQTLNYHKETQNLKVDSGKKIESSGNGNYNSNSNKDRTNSEAFSWRKKSGEGSITNTEEYINLIF
jgi:hypothetical protein